VEMNEEEYRPEVAEGPRSRGPARIRQSGPEFPRPRSKFWADSINGPLLGSRSLIAIQIPARVDEADYPSGRFVHGPV
jgi:hypothetical protein